MPSLPLLETGKILVTASPLAIGFVAFLVAFLRRTKSTPPVLVNRKNSSSAPRLASHPRDWQLQGGESLQILYVQATKLTDDFPNIFRLIPDIFRLRRVKSLALFICLLNFVGCVLTPLTEPYTARSLGKGKNEWAFSGGGGYVSVTYTKGVRDNLDISGLVENQAIDSLYAGQLKWQLNSKDSKVPFALFTGLGFKSNADFVYLGPIQSFEFGQRYILSLNARINYLNWGGIESGLNKNDGDLFFDPDVDGDYTYVSTNLSNTFWFTQKFGGTLSITALKFIDGRSLDDKISTITSLKFHFNY